MVHYGWTAREVSERLGGKPHPNQIGRWLRGDTQKPRAKTLQLLATALGDEISVEWLDQGANPPDWYSLRASDLIGLNKAEDQDEYNPQSFSLPIEIKFNEAVMLLAAYLFIKDCQFFTGLPETSWGPMAAYRLGKITDRWAAAYGEKLDIDREQVLGFMVDMLKSEEVRGDLPLLFDEIMKFNEDPMRRGVC